MLRIHGGFGKGWPYAKFIEKATKALHYLRHHTFSGKEKGNKISRISRYFYNAALGNNPASCAQRNKLMQWITSLGTWACFLKDLVRYGWWVHKRLKVCDFYDMCGSEGN